MKGIKSFEELGTWIDDHSFEMFKSMNPREKRQFLLSKGINLKATFNGKYIKEKQAVLIHKKDNPFTKGPLYAELLSDDSFENKEDVKVFLKYDTNKNCTPERVFKCESFNSLKNDFYRVESIEKPGGSIIGPTGQVLIFDYYLKHGATNILSEKTFFDLVGLLHKKPNDIHAEMNKYDNIIRSGNGRTRKLASINKNFIEMYELFYDDIDAYNKKIAPFRQNMIDIRNNDIIDSRRIYKSDNPIFDEKSTKRFKINVDKKTIKSIRKQQKYYFKPNELIQNENKQHSLVPPKTKGYFFYTLPPKMICNLYVNNKKELAISFKDTTIYEQRNGTLVRNVKIEEDFREEKTTKKETVSKPKVKMKKEKEKINHYIKVKPIDNKANLDKVNNNPHVKKLREEKRRIIFTNNNYNSAFECFDKTGAVRELQLIRSMHNHVTLDHEIENRLATIVYYDEYEGFTDIKILLHYCKRCRKYFDFYDSFLLQLQENNIKRSSLIITYLDDHFNPFVFDEISLNEHSILNLFGYSVGYSGLNKNERQALLDRIIRNKYMSAVEIKNHLEFLIRFNGKAQGKEYARLCWQEDIAYINDMEKNRLDKKP